MQVKNYLKRPKIMVGQPWDIPTLLAAYNWPKNGGAFGKTTIGIIEMGGGWKGSDIIAAFSRMALPTPFVTDVSVDGTRNTPGQDADLEVALDIQVAAAGYSFATSMAAEIRIYWVSEDMGAAVNMAAADGCDVFSMSWGAPEDQWGSRAVYAMNVAAVNAWKKGMACFAASGDNDAYDGDGHAIVDAPAACPQIIGCGGTTKPRIGPEVVWNNTPGVPSGEGTGGGFSRYFPVQTFQRGCPPPPAGLGRMVPDVAGCADPETGYNIILDGNVQIVGGTSAVAPLYAGLVAAAYGPKPGWILPHFYQCPSWFTDVTTGGNGLYNAAAGPDPVSGMGAPIANKFKRL